MKVIHVARKPLIGTVAKNALAHGTGGLNIDKSRIEGVPPSKPQPSFDSPTGLVYGFQTGEGRNGNMSQADGRWPANLILQHKPECSKPLCVPGCPVATLDEQSGLTRSAVRHGGEGEHLDPSLESWRFKRMSGGFDDQGGASRFFKQIGPADPEPQELDEPF